MGQTVISTANAREGDATRMRRRNNALAVVRAHQLLTEQVLLLLEESSLAGESRLQAQGKAAFRRRLEQEVETSHTGAAQRLFEGITGYIFRAFPERPSGPVDKPLESFRERVMDAIQMGAAETGRQLQAIGSRGIAADHALLRTLDLLHGKLERWYPIQGYGKGDPFDKVAPTA